MTIKFNKTEMLKDTRKAARELGMTFRENKNLLNGQKSYCLVDRKTGKVLATHMTVDGGYKDMLAGQFALISTYK